MYTLKITDENTVITTVKEKIIERSSYVDDIQIVVAKLYREQIDITAVYDPVIRNYTVEYILKPTLNASETVLQSSTGPFGSTIEYEGETPRYTAEESAFKYYLFKEWDKSGLVTGNKKIYTVFDSCEYTTGYFDGKDLGNLSEVELYTMMKMSLEKEKTKEADILVIAVKLGLIMKQLMLKSVRY